MSAAKKKRAIQKPWFDIGPAPLVLISGPTDALGHRASESIREQAKSLAPNLEQHELNAQEYVAGELFVIASPSLFGDPRLVRVDNGEQSNDAFIADLREYVNAPDSETALVVRHRGGNRGKAVLDAMRGSEGAFEVSCEKLKPSERADFVRLVAQRKGVSIGRTAAHALEQAFGEELGELAAVTEQLADEVASEITEQDVLRITEGRVEVTGFRVADAACAGNAAEALAMYRHAISAGMAPIVLLGSLRMKLQQIARVFHATGSQGEIASRYGMAPWMVKNAQRDARHWDEIALARMIDDLAETEWVVKGGGSNPEFAVERLLLEVASRGKRLGGIVR